MIVGSSRNNTIASKLYGFSKNPRIVDDLLHVGFVLRLLRFQETDCLGGDDVHQWSALSPWKDSSIQIFGKSFFAKNHASAGPSQGFVSCGGDKVAMGHRARVQS